MESVLPGIDVHPHARAVLRSALGPPIEASHAYLFHGPAGAGKRDIARAFAAALLSDGAPDPGSARERALRGAHPDLTWVAPSGAHEMRVQDIDEPVVAAAAHTPFEARRRVFVIEDADTMGDATANRLLKTLEEPSPHAHLILLTTRPGEVMETIVSRCQRVRFDPAGVEAIAARLMRQGVAPEAADACARLALGDGERALELAVGQGPALRHAAERLARAPLAGDVATERPWAGLLGFAKDAADRAVTAFRERYDPELELMASQDRRRRERELEDQSKRVHRRAHRQTLDAGLALAGLWYRDLAALRWEAPQSVHHSDRRAELAADAGERDPQALRAALELVEDTRRRLLLNVSEELALEALGYRLEALLAG